MIEAQICELRRQHPGWGPRRIEHQLARQGLDPVPSRSAIYRCLKRHELIELRRRKRGREDFKRWERERPMELWQMDVMGGVMCEDGSELKVVTGVDDHSRFCIAAGLVRRATSKAVCEVLLGSLQTYGVPDEVLTRQRQGLHGPLRPPSHRGLVRPDPSRARGGTPTHGWSRSRHAQNRWHSGGAS